MSKSILPCRQFGTSNARIDCSRERTHCRLIPPSVKLQPRSELRISSGMHVPSSWYARSICHSHVINDGSRSDSSVIPMKPFRYPIWTSWMDLRHPVNGRQRYEKRKFFVDIFVMSKVVAKTVLLIYWEVVLKGQWRRKARKHRYGPGRGAGTVAMMNPHRDPSLHKQPLRLYELHSARGAGLW